MEAASAAGGNEHGTVRQWICLALLILTLPLLLAGRGSVLFWCPVCGERGRYSYTKLYEATFKSEHGWREPCLFGEHRLLETSRTFSAWWQSGYTHATLHASEFRLQHGRVVEPWMQSDDTPEDAKSRLAGALRTATTEELGELLNEDHWAEPEDLLPWAESVLGEDRD